jgi:hypothetical protein
MQATAPSIGQYGVALATASGDSWTVVTTRPVSGNPNIYSYPLSTSVAGSTRPLPSSTPTTMAIWIWSRRAPAKTRRCRRSAARQCSANGFEGTLQTLHSAWWVQPSTLLPGASASLLLAHPLQMAGVWRSQVASNVLPIVQFQLSGLSVYPAPTLRSYLSLEPFAVAQTSLHIDAVSDSGGHSQWSEDLGAGVYALVTDAPVSAVAGELWTLNLTEVAPVGVGLIGARSSAQVRIVSPTQPADGQCYLEHLYLLLASLLGTAEQPDGSPLELDQLRRVRDQHLATSAAGRYYVELYAELARSVRGHFADPQFANRCGRSECVDAAINNWLDGDGAPVNAAMQSFSGADPWRTTPACVCMRRWKAKAARWASITCRDKPLPRCSHVGSARPCLPTALIEPGDGATMPPAAHGRQWCSL